MVKKPETSFGILIPFPDSKRAVKVNFDEGDGHFPSLVTPTLYLVAPEPEAMLDYLLDLRHHIDQSVITVQALIAPAPDREQPSEQATHIHWPKRDHEVDR